MVEMSLDASDAALVQKFARSNSEEAFAALVSRYVNLVYSVALRQVRDPLLAEDVTQVVFIILARKAGGLSPKTIIPGWLCRTARNVASRAHTAEMRRQRREKESCMQSAINETETIAWTHLEPLLDGALEQLGRVDHDAVVLRFFERKSFKEIGVALDSSEDSAKKRVSRALEKLRRIFIKRGVTLPVAVIAAAVTANSLQAAPLGLAKTATVAGMVKGATATGSISTLLKGALKLMAWTKLQTAIVAGVAALLAAGTVGFAVKGIEVYREDAVWRHITGLNWRELNAVQPTVSIRRAKAANGAEGGFLSGGRNKMLGFAKPVAGLLGMAYDINRVRIINPEILPPGKFDFLVTEPNPAEALQAAITKKFGLTATRETHETNVLILAVSRPDATGLKRTDRRGIKWTGPGKNGTVKFDNVTMDDFCGTLEGKLKIPVVNQTGLDGLYYIQLKNPGNDVKSLRQEMSDELGLELKPGTQSIEMLRVAKSK
jgi:uncharacterized protein (TIGR03435 family)